MFQRSAGVHVSNQLKSHQVMSIVLQLAQQPFTTATLDLFDLFQKIYDVGIDSEDTGCAFMQ